MDEQLKQQCWDLLQHHAPDSVAWNHYDLATYTEITDINAWRDFLLDPEVMEWLKKERNILSAYQLAKLTSNVAESKSVGQAQLINSLEKHNANQKEDLQTGPAFIYTYIPLSVEQAAAPNVFQLEEDIFLDDPEKLEPTKFGDITDISLT